MMLCNVRTVYLYGGSIGELAGGEAVVPPNLVSIREWSRTHVWLLILHILNCDFL